MASSRLRRFLIELLLLLDGCALSGLHSQPLMLPDGCALLLRLRTTALALRVGLAFAAAHHRDAGAGAGTGTVLKYAMIASISVGRRKCLKAGIRGVPSKMYSRTTPSSPPPAVLFSSGP